jgi:diacylglycerol kinase (ATP)
MKTKVILNPYANRWEAQRRRPEAEQALKKAAVDYDLSVSEYPGHGIEIAAQAASQGYDAVIAAGGDSTYNEVVNGLIQAAGGEPVSLIYGILPLGTANDLADNLGIPKDLDKAAQLIAKKHTRKIDVCKINERYFLNNSAVGFETAVTVQQMEMKRARGVMRYLLATLVTIYHNPQWHMDLEWDQGSYQGPVTLVSVGNNPRTGGIFYTVPNADPFDGKLSFVYGTITARLNILRVLPKTMKPGRGNYTEHPHVHEVHSTWLRVHTEPETPAHTDGEVFTRAIQDLSFRVFPAYVPMILPDPAGSRG